MLACRRVVAGALCAVALAGCGGGKEEIREDPSLAQQEVKPAYDIRKLGRAMRSLDAFAQRGDTRARDTFLLMAVVDPLAPEARLLRAYALEDRRLAWRDLDTLRKGDPKLALGFVGVMAVYVEWKLGEEAQKAYDAALERDPDLPVAHARMGNLALSQGNVARAQELYNLALKQDSQDGDALFGMARMARTAGRMEEALQLLEKTSAAWPELLSAVKQRAELLEATGRRKDAAQAFLASAKLEKRPYESLMHSAALLAQEGDRAAAEKVYVQALAENPSDAGLLATLAQLAGERGDKETQRAHLSRALETQPDDVDMQRALAQLYSETGEVGGAERHFLEVVRLKPDDQAAHLALARMYAGVPRYREALEHYDLAAEAGALDDASAGERARLATLVMIPLKPVTGADVNKVFAAALQVVVGAYESRLKDVPELKGEVTVELEVDPSVKVTATRLKDDTLNDDVLLANIYFTMKGAKFPAGKKARYTYPISFTGTAPAPGKPVKR